MENEVVNFASFDGGQTMSMEGILVSIDDDFVVIEHESKRYKFRRAPGSKSGWGTGPAKFWRLSLEERSKYCLKDFIRTRK